MKTYFYEEIDSTNTEAKRMIESGLCESALLVARHQTAGRGRQGKSFYSPNDSGIYMTVVLHPECRMDAAVTLTTTVACIVAASIEKVYGICPGIKWVNDLYLNDKKICGILCEAVNDYEKMQLKSVIIGIGINMSTTDYPDDIKEIAGALLKNSTSDNININLENVMPDKNNYNRGKSENVEFDKDNNNKNNYDIDNYNIDKYDKDSFCYEKQAVVNVLNNSNYKYSELVAEIATKIEEKIPANFSDFIEFYKAHSVCLNKEIYFIENECKTNGTAVDVDSEGGLVVELESGDQRILRSGEISVRFK